MKFFHLLSSESYFVLRLLMVSNNKFILWSQEADSTFKDAVGIFDEFLQ